MNDQPLLILHGLLKKHAPIQLLNIYKGLPISNEAVISSLDASGMMVKSVKFQLVCMYLTRETFIQSSALPYIVHASVQQLLPASLEVRLGNLEYVSGGIGERRQVRVEPTDLINGVIQAKNSSRTQEVSLADISMEGLAVYIPTMFFNPQIYRKGAEMVVHLTLPSGANPAAQKVFNSPASVDPMARFSRETMRGVPDTPPRKEITTGSLKRPNPQPNDGKLSLKGTIKNVRPEPGYGRVRIGLMTATDAATRAAISSFISQRQSEIIREVKTLFTLLDKLERS